MASNNQYQREQCIKLIRIHNEQLIEFDTEAARKRQLLSYRHFRRIESLDDTVSYLTKALILRRQYVQIQRFKLRIQKERVALLMKQATELKELKSQLGIVRVF